MKIRCKCASFDFDSGRYQCSVSGDGCMYFIPNSKRCAADYGEVQDVSDVENHEKFVEVVEQAFVNEGEDER